LITARTLAYQILLHISQNVSHPDRLIRSMLERHSHLAERDRALVTELVYGVVRWQGRLDWHIDQLINIKPGRISPTIRTLLRLALYQILFLDRVPDHAAVNETVRIAKATHPAYLAGFVNGVLREAIRRGDGWDWPAEQSDPEQYLAATTAHPAWLVALWLRELGFAETRELCLANNRVAPMTLRVNTLKTDASRVLARLLEKGFRAERSPYIDEAIRVFAPRQDVTQCEIYEQGWIQIQDEASQLVSHLVAPQAGEKVLDLCSGFGGKAIHLGMWMGNVGAVTAVDEAAWKLERLQDNAKRQGVAIIHTMVGSVLELHPDQYGEFDRVFIDVPCTGLGTLRRNPDIKWRRHPKDPHRLARVQAELLSHAAGFVKTGGALVYATCTLLREENERVAERFSATHPHFVLQPAAGFLPETCGSMADGHYFKSWPHRHGIDGFFAARWQRVA